ncbi:MAG TPA: hypothetical protein VJU78_13580 [Chitinophagaceae bacterium]|nr:hypothetical protein [Chitinophagaceae bacterium]
MRQPKPQAAIGKLLEELTRKTKEYCECLKRDHKLETSRKIRIRIKEIQHDISRLNRSSNDAMGKNKMRL